MCFWWNLYRSATSSVTWLCTSRQNDQSAALDQCLMMCQILQLRFLGPFTWWEWHLSPLDASSFVQKNKKSPICVVFLHFPILGLHPEQGGRRQTQTICHQLHARHVLSHLGHGLQSHSACWQGQCTFVFQIFSILQRRTECQIKSVILVGRRCAIAHWMKSSNEGSGLLRRLLFGNATSQ